MVKLCEWLNIGKIVSDLKKLYSSSYILEKITDRSSNVWRSGNEIRIIFKDSKMCKKIAVNSTVVSFRRNTLHIIGE